MIIVSASGQNLYSCESKNDDTPTYMKISESTGFITSPNYPEPYTNKANCFWDIMVEGELKIHLTFLKFEIEEG